MVKRLIPPRADNIGKASQSYGKVFSACEDDYRAFDKLPRYIRDFLNHAPVKVSAISALSAVTEMGAFEAFKLIQRSVHEIETELQLKDAAEVRAMNERWRQRRKVAYAQTGHRIQKGKGTRSLARRA